MGEGGRGAPSKTQAQSQISGLKKFKGGWKMHCSHCRQPGHWKPKFSQLHDQGRNEAEDVQNEGDQTSQNGGQNAEHDRD